MYRVYAPRIEYAFMEENGPVDHGRLRRKRCERGASFNPPWRTHECSWRIIVPPRPIPLHSPRVFSIHLALNPTLSYNSSHAPVVEPVDTADSKSAAVRRAGSSPARGTIFLFRLPAA